MRKLLIGALLLCTFAGAALLQLTSEDEMKEPTTPQRDQSTVQYTMPDESEPHEGTWLEWPHQYQYGEEYRDSLDETWVAMTQALVPGEKVHIVAYDAEEQARITELLSAAETPLEDIDFTITKNDDVWMRDNGPIYVRDRAGNLAIEDWGFNGWGGKEQYADSDTVPSQIARTQNLPLVDLNQTMINEGGAVEIDDNGTLMATRSSILNKNRNPGMSQTRAEELFNAYLGATNFIWLDGKAGTEITDMHIDGFARFGPKNTIVTMNQDDLREWELPENDIIRLYDARDAEGSLYKRIILPLTKSNVVTKEGKDLGYRGSYVNYYIANDAVLVPNYDDPNDVTANATLQQLYPTRKIIGINVQNLFENGGMIHCVTQQQPAE